VGNYVNEHFYSAYQKVGTFKIVNGQKQGGNVATYFCLPDGTVLNAIAGPVDAKTFLQEARWVVETRKTAITESKGEYGPYTVYFRNAHAERFLQQSGGGAIGNQRIVRDVRTGKIISRGPANTAFGVPQMNPFIGQPAAPSKLPATRPVMMPPQAQVQWLLGTRTAPKLNEIYKLVYEGILGEKISNLPVLEE
jgi:hypothetical protein